MKKSKEIPPMRKKRTLGQNWEINLAMTEMRLSNFQTSLKAHDIN